MINNQPVFVCVLDVNLGGSIDSIFLCFIPNELGRSIWKQDLTLEYWVFAELVGRCFMSWGSTKRLDVEPCARKASEHFPAGIDERKSP